MKKSILSIFVVLAVLFTYSCGGSSDKDKNESGKTEKGENESKTKFSISDGLITADFSEKWEAGETNAKGPDSWYLYSYIIEDCDNIWEAAEDIHNEVLDEIKEVKVDGVPALTLKTKFMQNEEKISRSWYIYNGKDVILFVVQSNTEIWDDAIAEEVINAVKVNEREEDVVLPEKPIPEQHIRPEEYPEAGVAIFDDFYGEVDYLDEEGLKKSIKVYKELQDLKENSEYTEEDVLLKTDSILTSEYGEGNGEEYAKSTGYCMAIYGAMQSFNEIQNLDEESQDYEFLYSILKAAIEQLGYSKNDIRFVYDNWELCRELVELTE